MMGVFHNDGPIVTAVLPWVASQVVSHRRRQDEAPATRILALRNKEHKLVSKVPVDTALIWPVITTHQATKPEPPSYQNRRRRRASHPKVLWL